MTGYHQSLIDSLAAKIDEVLRPLLAGVSSCALIDFPDHPNVGDSVIWLGERAYLRRLGVRVSYTCTELTYCPDVLASRVTGGVILIRGGGNLGDLWPRQQHFRERVITDFRNRRIIQLPQSIHFQDQTNLSRARVILGSHPDLTVLVRDQSSLALAQGALHTNSLLCPDMAFALGSLPRLRSPQERIVILLRTDHESALASSASHPTGIPKTDWMEDDSTVLLATHEFITRQGYEQTRLGRAFARFRFSFSDAVARQRLVRGCRHLGRGRVVITDRLHGHILALLLGIPHVILDNTYGKLRSFYETWTKGCDLATWANSFPEALEVAHGLAREGMMDA